MTRRTVVFRDVRRGPRLGVEPAVWNTTSPNIRLKELKSVTGLEFHWVVLVIRASLIARLESAFVGATRRVYNARRMLRVPLPELATGSWPSSLPDVPRPTHSTASNGRYAPRWRATGHVGDRIGLLGALQP
jgi:hypothetical protein